MHKSTFICSTWLLLSTLILPGAVSASDDSPLFRVDLKNGQFLYDEGKGDATACGMCHGEKALGVDDMESSRLANIGQVYVVKQLDDYAADLRTDPGAGAVMNDIARALTEKDRLDLAAYMDSFSYEMESSDLKTLKAEGIKIGDPDDGKEIITDGIKGVTPPCLDCHGFSGRANNIPAIHQQKYIYLVNQMNRYRDGSRMNDRVVFDKGIMRGISKDLTDKNIQDISAYLSTVTNLTQ